MWLLPFEINGRVIGIHTSINIYFNNLLCYYTIYKDLLCAYRFERKNSGTDDWDAFFYVKLYK